MLNLYIEVKHPTPEDKKRFLKIIEHWRKEFIELKVKQILNKEHIVDARDARERITIERGNNYFAVFSWLKRE